jgi:hypothetical protein
VYKKHRIPGKHYLEKTEQRQLFKKLDEHKKVYPYLGRIYPVANEAASSSRQSPGVKKGVWDLAFDGWREREPIGDEWMDGNQYYPFRMELKARYNKLTPEQEDWGDYYAENTDASLYVCYTWQDAWDAIRQHFSIQIKEKWDEV